MSDDDYPWPVDQDAPPQDGHDDPWLDAGTGEVMDAGSAALLEKVLGLVVQVQEEQQSQQKRLSEIEDDLKAAPDGPWNWANLTGDARRKLWERLYEWVSWLEDRYLRNLFPVGGIIPEFPADWYRHPVAVEMLTALMVSHAAAYRKKAAPPSFALVEWHERCLWPTLARMESLKLFTRGVADSDWDGPIERSTRRSDDRFGAWMAADVDASSAEGSL